MNKYILEIVVFICGAVVMVFELVGSRLLAPYLGTSIFVWTSLIGVILGSLSMGYWWGGRLADSHPSRRVLSLVILLSAVAIGIVAVFQSTLLAVLPGRIPDVRIGAFFASLILFSPAGFLLGTISPLVVRIKLKAVKTSGATIGRIYAISTIGSIVGTFTAGFFLIAYFGSTAILFILTVILAATSLLVYPKKRPMIRLVIIFIFLFGYFIHAAVRKNMEAGGVLDIDTNYNRVWIYPAVESMSRRPVLALVTDPYGVQSAMFRDSDNDLALGYTKYYRLVSHFSPGFRQSLMIGGGAYSFPKDYLRRYPGARLDVAEIDPKLTELAKRYFNLKDDPRLTIYHEDGRTFLNRTKNKYDAIFIDAFNSNLAVPYQLTTREAINRIYNALNPDGVVIVNIIAALADRNSDFLRAEVNTYLTEFPQVYLFPVESTKEVSDPRNIIMICLKSESLPEFKSDDPQLNDFLGHLWTGDIELDLPVLTDDYAPVDYYTRRILTDS